ncbi:MAG TPA: hypothetical protein VGG72_20010 [Bryobacteraceae bacterium]|jgi:hypothetical protein
MSNTFRPAAKITMFPITAAIWHNEKDGRSFYSVSFQRSYKDEKGKWRNSESFGLGDLLLLAKVAEQAHSEIYKLRGTDREGQQSEDDLQPSDG